MKRVRLPYLGCITRVYVEDGCKIIQLLLSQDEKCRKRKKPRKRRMEERKMRFKSNYKLIEIAIKLHNLERATERKRERKPSPNKN